MINEKELQISNKSYTNKDFPVVYTELLDLIKMITNKWDPATSNESDPGVVLLKLLAFIADKLNYNIDKNLLERFMLSATQATSMRELCEMMGYEMNYYVAATTKITFSFSGQEDENGDQKLQGTDFFVIPQFTTVTSANSDVHYITKSDVRIDSAVNYTGVVEAIEGDLNTLTANDSEIIRLENLDDSLRVYFPVPNVAQNGIFIRTIDSEYTGSAKKYWTRVTNLNSEALGQNIYKFGYDSRKGKPYIEFPSDIAKLIKSGLFIQYVTTSGKEGNVKARYLTVLESPTSFSINNNPEKQISFTDEEGNTGLGISNFSASMNGADPETIDEAYNGFKKTVGTFNTLVTCRDYMNVIYNMLNEDEFPLVSNVNATDRRTDINFACKITSFNEYGTYTITSPIAVIIDGSSYTITPFDLCLYPLNPIYSYTENGTEQFVSSFKPLLSTWEIKQRLEDGKSISHNYVTTSGTGAKNLTYTIKNYLTLNVNVSTVNKVYPSEQADIVKNIQLALVKNFNAREVDYGYEIPFDTLLKVIQESDARISAVSLAEPTLKTVAMDGEGVETELTTSSDLYYKLVAMNILAGRVALFNYDTEFDYEFGQKKINNGQDMKTSGGLKSVTTKAEIPYTSLNTTSGYTLKPNEVIQVIAPSYVTVDQYPACCLFSFYSTTHTEENPIPNGTLYRLQEGEYLYMNYKTDTQNITEVYGPGTIIQPMNIKAYDGTSMGLVATNPLWETKVNSRAINLPYYRYTIAKNKSDLGPNGMAIDSPIATPVKINPDWEAIPQYGYQSYAVGDLAKHDHAIYRCNTAISGGETWNSDHWDLVEPGDPDYIPEFVPDESRTNEYLFNSLTAEESINIKKKKEVSLTKPFYCYWIVKNTDNQLFFTSGDEERTLMEGEYFFYTDYTFTNLVTVGSGTTLSKHGVSAGLNGEWKARHIDFEELEEKGLLGLRDYWSQAAFTQGGVFTITENSILTVTSEDRIAFDNLTSEESPAKTKLDNTFSKISFDNATYQVKGEDAQPLNTYDSGLGEGWKIRSRLDINAGRSLIQPIRENQSMVFTKQDDTTYTVQPNGVNPTYINLSELTQVAGGNDIDLSQFDFVRGVDIYPINVYNYELDSRLVSRDVEDYASLQFNKGSIDEYSYSIPNLGERAILMLYFVVDKSTDANATITVTADSGKNFALCSNTTLITSLTVSSGKIYCLDLNDSEISGASTNINELTFSIVGNTGAKGSLIVDKIRYTKTGVNPLLDISNVNKLLTQIRTLDSNGDFYYTNRVNNDSAINLDKVEKLSDPQAYYDFNNVANRFTISEIDFSTSVISIARSSRR